MKSFYSICLIFFAGFIIAQPANDNCANATSLTVGSSLQCSQTTNNASLEGSECYTNYGGGSTETTVWYRFSATTSSLVLNLIKTNSTNCSGPHIRVYGPFGPGAGCMPACTNTVYNALHNGDPGNHILLTGLSTATNNNQYLVQVQSNDCGGANDGFTNFCLNMQAIATNATSSGASNLNACGSAFAGSTNGGYYQSGTGTGFNNLDNNASTTCSGCSAGADTPFIINNASWFSFCSATAGTWQITVNGVSGCTLPSPNQGVQASVFTGTTTALVNQGNSQNPIPVGGSWTSGVITVNAGSCAWLMIDGFAGDACNYNVTLTNVSGGCIVLPVDIAGFSGYKSANVNILEWSTLTERTGKDFAIEKSVDGKTWKLLGVVEGNYNSTTKRYYSMVDESPEKVMNYYRLKQTDVSGRFEYFRTIMIDNRDLPHEGIQSVTDLLGNNYGKVIPPDYKGILVVKYNDGTCRKIVVTE
jgi:hypothetical protein